MNLEDVEFEIAPDIDESEVEEILRCLRAIILTPAGSAPAYRNFGVNNEILDMPMNMAQTAFTVEVMEKVARYEPRVIVEAVEFTPGLDGSIKAKVVIRSA
mgnify:CR=1 FL=1